MKRLFAILTTTVLCLSATFAVPAHKGKVTRTQPDGSSVRLCLHGDEYLHYTTTDDGYSVVRNADGYYVYADITDGQLVGTSMVAHDIHERNAAEMSFLANRQKYQAPAMTEAAIQERQAEQQRQARARAARRAPQYDYNKFRGLVILVEFNDKSFSRDDYKEIIDSMINQKNYTGYIGTNGRKQNCTGSVRDYFYDNSMGLFDPQFDVFGPYQVNYSQYDGNIKGNKVNKILNAAVNAANSDVNFADYDGDGDGNVDLIFFVLAGNGANYSGNNGDLWWPHRSILFSSNGGWLRKDGVYLTDYASSTELQGYTSQPGTVKIDGIGTICHEFSHVLGLPDFYDTDEGESGGNSNTPGGWSVMDGGCYMNDSRTPVGYSMLERSFVGFGDPQTLEEEGSYQLDPIGTSNTGYRMNTPVDREYFIFENRQKTWKWDAYLPGHGMLVFRVDFTNNYVWNDNTVNANPKHNYYELIRAGGTSNNATSDPFPGTKKVRTLSNTTSPASLQTWEKKNSPFGLSNIQEQNGIITFNVFDAYVLSSLFLPNSMSLGLGMKTTLVPERFPEEAPFTFVWATDNEEVATVDEEGTVTAVGIGEALITVTGNDTVTAACKIIVNELPKAESITAFREMEEGDEATLQLHDAQVLYAYGNDVYLRDSTGTIILKETGLQVNQGDVLNGSIYGAMKMSNKMPTLAAVDILTQTDLVEITQGDMPEPIPVTMSQLDDSLYAELVLVKEATLERSSGVWAVLDDSRVRLWNPFQIKGIKLPSSIAGKQYDILAIYGTDVLDNEVINELYMLQSPTESEDLTGIIATHGELKVTYQNGVLVADGLPAHATVIVNTLDGRVIAKGQAGRNGRLHMPLNVHHPAVYVVRIAGEAIKMMIK